MDSHSALGGWFVAIEHIWKTNGLHIRYYDSVEGSSLVAAALVVGSDERFDDLRYILSDWSDCTDSNVGVDDVGELAAYISAMARSNPRITNLNVMRNDLDNQAFVNLYMFLTDEVPWKVLAYWSLEEARAWLRDNMQISDDELLRERL